MTDRQPTLYRIEFNNITCGIEVDESGMIINTAPVLKVFKGQHITALDGWLDRFKNVKVEVAHDRPTD